MFPRVLLALGLLLAVTALHAADRPNVVLILADDLGINDLGCYGRKEHSTPNLDRLAGEGVRFTSSYCAQAICSASRAALLTGKCPARLHLTNFLPGRADAPSQRVQQPVIEGQLPLEEVTIAERLRDAGYATGHIGKWHLGNAGFGPQEQGFDFTYAGRANTVPSATEGSKGEYDLTAHAERWLDEHRQGPFFLYLAHNSPHIPFAALPEDAARYAGAFNPVYAAVIEHLDRCVGRIMAKVDALGLKERTIFIFASDNGGLHVLEFAGTPATRNTPYRSGKGYCYEGGLRVPLIVRWPGTVRPGWVSDTPVVLTDLVPTLLEAAGVDLAQQVGPLDGVSLTHFLAGGALAPRPLFWHFPNYTNQGGRPAGAMRDGDWKLLAQYEDGQAELYNLAEDPGETKDLALQEPARVAAMTERLMAWRRSVGAQETSPNFGFDEFQHRALYVDRDPSRLTTGANAAEVEREWQDWRVAMDAAVKGLKPIVTPAQGDIRLLAKDAHVHGTRMHYEEQPQKNTLGFWTQPEDWAEWDCNVTQPGKYAVEVLQGCAGGGSEVAVEIAGQTLKFTVADTGHFQNFIQRTVGVVDLPLGRQSLTVRPLDKKGAAVMDLRRVVLRPVP